MRGKLIALCVVALFGMAMYLEYKDNGKDGQIRELKQQLAHAQIHTPVQHDTIFHDGDSIEVATSPVIEMKMRELEKQHLVDKQLLKELQLKMKQLQSVQSTTTVTEDSAKAEIISGDSIFRHTDKWSRIEFNIKDTTFYYNIRDSLSTFVAREYKHRFLWWRWGTKGYKISIVNHNPHTHIVFNRYIHLE